MIHATEGVNERATDASIHNLYDTSVTPPSHNKIGKVYPLFVRAVRLR